MRTWTKSACVVLAWSILPVILVAIGMHGSARQAQANTRTASSTEVILTSKLSVAAATATTTKPITKYVVRDGDTLSGIATRFAVPGGWLALYAANRPAIGPDPDVIRAGMVLVVPGAMTPVRYTVAAGDTLSGIASRLALPGGWPTLYAANRPVIGPDPDVIHSGTVLTVPRPAAAPSPSTSVPSPPTPAPSPPSPAPSPPGQAHPQQRPPAPQPSPRASAAPQPRPWPAARRAPTATGMPRWLKIMLAAAGLLILAAFLAEPLLLVRRRRRHAPAQVALRLCPPGPGLPPAEQAHIVLADYDRLVVTRSQRDGTVYVLRPPGEDPRAILRVARLVVPESGYGELARKLGVPASWPME
jgi:LysM repeat protein